MKKQNYLCVDLKVRMQERGLSVGEGRNGMLVMTEDGEKFEFDETLPDWHRRNPKVWEGDVLNVHRNRQGELVVSFRRIVLTKDFNPRLLTSTARLELTQAKKVLGL